MLFDSARLPPHERAEGLRAVYAMAGGLTVTSAANSALHHHIMGVDLGPGVRLMRNSGGPLGLLRTPRDVRAARSEMLLLGLNRQGEWSMDVDGSPLGFPTGGLIAIGSTDPFDVRLRTAGSTDVLMVSYAELGVPVDVVRSATWSLARSPVLGLLRGHLAGLFDAVSVLPRERQLEAGRATTLLARTLLLTAAEHADGRDALADSLEVRVRAYVEAHLADTDLSVAQIAAAHHVSRRHLYDAWARAGHDRTPGQWIAHQRLERARRQLTDPGSRRTDIAAVARTCGFADPSHFSRRFKEAYGAPPDEWRRSLVTPHVSGGSASRPVPPSASD